MGGDKLKIDNLLDILVLVAWLAVGTAATVWSLISIRSNVEDYTTSDKIAISPYDDNTPIKPTMDTRDIILMCVIADRNQPYPASIQLNENTEYIVFNNSFFADTETNINNIWNSQVSLVIDKSIQDFDISYEGGNVRWKIVTD